MAAADLVQHHMQVLGTYGAELWAELEAKLQALVKTGGDAELDVADGAILLDMVALYRIAAPRILNSTRQVDLLAFQVDALQVALVDACQQLEGWVAWKCPAKHKAEHTAYIAKLRAVAELPGHSSPVHGALRVGLDALLRMIPGYVRDAKAEPCTDVQHDAAIRQAALVLFGPQLEAWPRAVRTAAEGGYEG